MATIIGQVEAFDEAREQWPTYVERFEHFVEANGISEGKRVPVFLSVMGASTYGLLRSLIAPVKPGTMEYEEIVNTLQAHFTPRPIVIAERFKFHKRNQAEGESVAQYVAVLKKLAEHCEFGDNLNDALRDRFLCGLSSESIQRKLLTESELTYKKAVEIAMSMEAVSRESQHLSNSLKEKQLLQGPVKPLDWRYPIVPEVQSELAVDFQLRQPVTPSSVAVQCGENRVLVEVQQDFFSNGQLIQPTGLSLGGCPVVGQDPESRVLIFEYELQDCNSVLMLNEDELVYTFSLTYTPEALAGTPITRADGAVVGVQCHYQRLQNVSSDALRPTWVPYASTEAGQEVLLFSLKIMMDDWSYQRPSYFYFLGGVINIEASVMQYNHVPLRVFVDHCVATQVPDVNSLPRYSFIENHGCFVDAKTTTSSSRFMPRSQVDKIQFQLEAFMFQEGNSPSIYITCILKATIASAPSDAQRKSCSFANGWFAADGNDQVCGCCDSTCGPDGEFAASPYGGIQWEGKASLGPVMVQGQKKASQ